MFSERIYKLYAQWEQARENSVPFDLEKLATTDERVDLLRLIDELRSPKANVPARTELPPSTERYRFLEFLARGGMGEVFHGEDVLLNRRVALKVLRKRLGISVHKFREEAQLVARLTHPGIVPVHDFGELADGRPFFAMKLVEGATLEEVLGDSNAQSPHVPRWLQYFEQICQAVAYAHSQNPPLLHRDLKPQNVMIGAYGEVLVMDWGIAKVIAESQARSVAIPSDRDFDGETPIPAESTADESTGEWIGADGIRGETATGIAKGTPAYMAPEQARGLRDQIGAHSDVFALGGILCRILTGRATFVGNGAIGWSIAGDLAEPHARLDQCGADPELISLAKQCLAPGIADRPATAAAIVTRLREYFDQVRERLKTAELERARAETRAEGERRRRRLQLGLSGVVCAMIVFIGLAIWRIRDQQTIDRLRGEQFEALARQAIADGEKLHAEARLDPLNKEGRFSEAATMFQNAHEFAARAEHAELIRTAEKHLAQANADVQQAPKNRMLLAELLDLNRPQETGIYLAAQSGEPVQEVAVGAEERFLNAFRRWGIAEFDRHTVDELTAILGREPGPIVQELVAGLDEWAAERRFTQNHPNWQTISELAHRLDQHDKRRLIRRIRFGDELQVEIVVGSLIRETLPWSELMGQVYGRNRQQLREIGRAIEPSDASTLTLFSLQRFLIADGEKELAESLLRSFLARRPSDVLIRTALGKLLLEEGLRWEDAIRQYEAARAIRPELGVMLSVALSETNRTGEAESILRDLIARQPHANPELLGNLAVCYHRQRKYAEAEATLRQAISLRPNDHRSHHNLGLLLADLKRYPESEAAYRQAIAINSSFLGAHINLGGLLRKLRRSDEAEASYRNAVALDPSDPETHYGLGTVLSDQGKHAAAEKAYREAYAMRPEFPTFVNALGGSLEKQGKFKEAESVYRRAIEQKPDDAEAHIRLGKVLIRLRKFREAEAEYQLAITSQPKNLNALIDLGDFLRTQKRSGDAEVFYRRAAEAEPKKLTAWNSLGSVLHDQGKFAEAEACFRKVIAMDATKHLFHFNLGNALASQGKFAAAQQAYETSIWLKPDYSEAHVNLGCLFLDQGRLGDAEAIFRKAAEAIPGSLDAICNLAEVLNQQQKHEESEQVARKAIALNPEYAVAHAILAQALRDQKKYREAVAALRDADRLQPNHPVIRNDLRTTQRLLELDQLLDRITAGNDPPSDSATLVDLAEFCGTQRALPVQAVRYYSAAFRLAPRLINDLRRRHRFHAARAAIQAATSMGRDAGRLMDEDCLGLSRLARRWLQADLAVYQELAPTSSAEQRAQIATILDGWEKSADLAPVRKANSLAGFPESERSEWEKFWAEVRIVHREIAAKR